MLDFSEKRKNRRIDIRLPIAYKQLRRMESSPRGVLTKNLSTGGVRFHTDNFISLSCRMVIELTIPSMAKPLRAISKVAWIRKLPNSASFEIGNQFLDMSKDDKNLISDYVENSFEVPSQA